MDTTELLKKVRKLEIKTRGLSNQLFSGSYHSAFKGRGMTFSEVREYQPGDDVRTIDWNVTARLNAPFIKVFEEERELTVMLLVDASGSKEFGTKAQMKQELVTELAAVLAFSAIQNNDKIGVIFFTDIIEKFIPPKKGKSHILRIIRELLDFEPQHKLTDIPMALRYLTNVIKKRSISFLISDFMDEGFYRNANIGVGEEALRIANKKHDVVALRICDEREMNMPAIGLAKFKDAETGKVIWVDTSNRKVREQYNSWQRARVKTVDEIFLRCAVDSVTIRTDGSYIKPLMNFFKTRGKRA